MKYYKSPRHNKKYQVCPKQCLYDIIFSQSYLKAKVSTHIFIQNKMFELISKKLQLITIQENNILSDFTQWGSFQEGGQTLLLFSRNTEKILLLCNQTLYSRVIYPNKGTPAAENDYSLDEEKFDCIFEHLINEGWHLHGQISIKFEGKEKKIQQICSIVKNYLDFLVGKTDPVTGKLLEPVFITSKLEDKTDKNNYSSVIGNYTADMIKENTGSDIALIPRGIITDGLYARNTDGEPVNRGLLTGKDIYKAFAGFPCEEFISKDFTLRKLKETMEANIMHLTLCNEEIEGDKKSWLFHISGLKIEYDPQKHFGEKIKNLYFMLDDMEHIHLIKDGVQTEEARRKNTYRVTYPLFLSRGIKPEFILKETDSKNFDSIILNIGYENLQAKPDEKIERHEIKSSSSEELEVRQINIAKKALKILNESGENLVINDIMLKINEESLQFGIMKFLIENPPVDGKGNLRRELMENRIKPVGGPDYLKNLSPSGE